MTEMFAQEKCHAVQAAILLLKRERRKITLCQHRDIKRWTEGFCAAHFQQTSSVQSLKGSFTQQANFQRASFKLLLFASAQSVDHKIEIVWVGKR